MSADFKFPLTEVKENGQLPVNAQTPASTFPDALTEGTLLGTVKLDGMILAVDEEAAFNGEAKGRWRFECTRCLEPIEADWRTPIEVMVPIDGGPMDLTDEVRQSIALAQPMKLLCKPDCKGLCPTCGKNLNTSGCGHAGVPAASRPSLVEEAPTSKPRLVPKRKNP